MSVPQAVYHVETVKECEHKRSPRDENTREYTHLHRHDGKPRNSGRYGLPVRHRRCCRRR